MKATSQRRPRGLALIFVLLLLTMVLYLAMSFLLRGNNNLFTISRDEQSATAFSVAGAAAHYAAYTFAHYVTNTSSTSAGSVSSALSATLAQLKKDQASDGTTIKDTSGNVIGYTNVQVYINDEAASSSQIGYADVSYTIDSPKVTDTTSTFGSGTYSLAYSTITFQAVGSPSRNGAVRRVTRTVREAYNVAAINDTLPAVFNFAYFMNNWAWWAGFSSGQARILGNTGANGNYDILSGYISKVGSNPGFTFAGNDWGKPDIVTQKSVREATSNVSGISGYVLGGSSNGYAQNTVEIYTPDVSDFATADSSFYRMATGQDSRLNSSGETVTTKGKLVVQTGTVKTDSKGELIRDSSGQVTFSPTGSERTLTDTGVYPSSSSQKDNVVIGIAPGTTASTTYTVEVVKIDGPVVIKGDVVLQGLVSGRGTLAAGRNVYLSGDVQYVTPPSNSPAVGNNGYYSTTKTPSGSTAASGVAATSDYTSDQLLLVASENVVNGDVTNKSNWWTNAVEPWLDWTDPATGTSVSGDKDFDYYEDFAFANAASDSSTYGFNSTNFDNIPSGTSTYSKHILRYSTTSSASVGPARIDAFVVANQAAAGFLGRGVFDSSYKSNRETTQFGGLIAKQDAQIINAGDYYKGGWKRYNFNIYQDQRFTTSKDLGLPSKFGSGAILVTAGWSER